MTTTTKPERPYPNVARIRHSHRWEARHPTNGRARYLGTYPTPEGAYRAVLIAQAEHLEAKAATYRNRAENLT